jgi:tetratricopeptide (TPR) repeat protein
MLTESIEATKFLTQKFTVSEQKRSSFLGGDCLLTAGILYCDHGEYDLAINYLTKALLLFHRYDEPEWRAAMAKTQIVFGSVYYKKGDYAAALDYYLQAEEITSDSGDYSSLRNVLRKIGDCYINLHQFDTACIYAGKILKFAEKLKSSIDEYKR